MQNSEYYVLFALFLIILASFQSLADSTPYERHRAITTYLSAIFFMMFAMFLKMGNK